VPAAPLLATHLKNRGGPQLVHRATPQTTGPALLAVLWHNNLLGDRFAVALTKV
jgi:hypothetical protein